ncbi:MAG: dynamin family protein [Gammaproteobacteria bacterium]|nr:dynamin family protein [Gammaproteobacteria bacterium]
MTPKERYKKLEQHLSEENPILLKIIKIYQELDVVGYRTGLLKRNESYASTISWWPLISVLGTFSAGKSTFINGYTQRKIQTTGNQAVDDKFTVVCYGENQEVTTLPGLALDSDPRFPFFGISEQIEKVESGQGSCVDSYLQLKTTNSDVLKGKILIDSPGFDADSQRDSTLKITNHIIDMSDLVLVFFDARHPEPGAMRDTLEHLVATTIKRNDSDKILYILNQIDTAAHEDNPEEVIGSWQRAIAAKGLVGGNFYAIYNEEAANAFANPALAERFKRKKDIDLERIFSRMSKVSTERTYRIAHSLELLANEITQEKIPLIQKAVKSWRKKVLITDLFVFSTLFIGIFYLLSTLGYFEGSILDWTIFKLMQQSVYYGIFFSVISLGSLYGIHQYIRAKFAQRDAKKLMKTDPQVANAFLFNTRFWRGMAHANPRGWSGRNRMALERITDASKRAIQKLNDQFVNPTGKEKMVTHPQLNERQANPSATFKSSTTEAEVVINSESSSAK